MFGMNILYVRRYTRRYYLVTKKATFILNANDFIAQSRYYCLMMSLSTSNEHGDSFYCKGLLVCSFGSVVFRVWVVWITILLVGYTLCPLASCRVNCHAAK